MKKYTQDFYLERHKDTVYSAETILTLVLKHIPTGKSAVDFGCGVGTWLSVLKKMGFHDVLGLDGKWVDKNLLEIPNDSFMEVDFTSSFDLGFRKFDLAISLEVAEHLPPECAHYFVKTLTDLSDFVLFSAAIPFQDGLNHINEQWPEYWSEIFNNQGYICLDFVRNMIWTDSSIPFWYKQNILLFVKENRLSDIKFSHSNTDRKNDYLSVVHPDLYMQRNLASPSVKQSSKKLAIAIGNWLFKKTRKIFSSNGFL
jgi:SAM-dependent methyltransferase